MKEQKLYHKVISFIFLAVFGIFMLTPEISEAAENYTVGIVGIESRVKNINLGEYMNLDEIDKSPLSYAQELFHEVVLYGDLKKIGLKGVENTAYANMARKSEEEFQKIQAQMRQAMNLLDNGDTSEAVKLFDKQSDYLIYGYINNITVSHREAFGTSNTILSVNLSVRIVDAETGKIVCVATGEGSTSNHGDSYKKTLNIGNDKVELESWIQSLQKAMDQVVEKIIKQA